MDLEETVEIFTQTMNALSIKIDRLCNGLCQIIEVDYGLLPVLRGMKVLDGDVIEQIKNESTYY